MSFLFVVTQVTETRTGPLGCSNYDNLDSVSSVLVQSPENKVQLQGLSDILVSHFYCDCHDMCIFMKSTSEEEDFLDFIKEPMFW